MKKKNTKLNKTCLNIDCPERTGGECKADVDWLETFKLFHKGYEFGSASWLVSPMTVEVFIKGLVNEKKL